MKMDEPPLFNLLWNNHDTTIIGGFQRLHRDEIFCDATIVCDGKYFPVHRLILSSCSDYFEEIFMKTPCKHPFVVLKDVSAEVFEALLDFMYSGEVNIPEELFHSFIETGKLLQIKELSINNDGNHEQVLDSSYLNKNQSNNRKTDAINEATNVFLDSEAHLAAKDRSSNVKKYSSLDKRKRLSSSLESYPPKRVKKLMKEPKVNQKSTGTFRQHGKVNSDDSFSYVSDSKSDFVRINTASRPEAQESMKKLGESFQSHYSSSESSELLSNEVAKSEEPDCSSSSKTECQGTSLTQLVIKKEEPDDEENINEDSDAYGPDTLEEEFALESQYYPEDWCQSSSDPEFVENSDCRYEESDSETEKVIFNTKTQLLYSCASHITVRCSSNTPDKRIWNKRQYCAFCSTKSFTNITKHLLNHHSKEKEVMEILRLPLNSLERKVHLERVRNIGNYNHNCSVLQSECGEIIPWRCPPLAVNYQDYLPCQYCYGFFYIRELSKHNRNCKFKQVKGNEQKESRSRKLISESRLLLPAKKTDRLGLQEKVLGLLQSDAMLEVVKGDPLITEFGVKKFEKLGHLSQQHVPISQKMRELAVFLITAKNMDSEIKTLSDVINPSKLSVVSEVIRKMAGYKEDENAFENPSLVSKIGHSLYQCGYILKRSSVFERNFLSEKRCDAFLDLLREELRTKCFLP